MRRRLIAGWLASPLLLFVVLRIWVAFVPALKHSMLGMLFVILFAGWVVATGAGALAFGMQRLAARRRH